MLRFIPLVICLIISAGTGFLFLNYQPEHTQTHASTIINSEPVKETSSQTEATSDISKDHPIAVVDSDSFDFGIVSRFTQSEHFFTIKNEGTAPLQLTQGPSSCSCTVLGLTDKSIEPGENASIKLSWNASFKEGIFQQTAIVYTNDPNNKEIEFKISGVIETLLGASRDSIVFSSLVPGQQSSQEIFIYSKVSSELSEFTFTSSGTGPELKTEWVKATPEELEEHKALSGAKLKITVPPSDKEQTFTKNCVISAKLNNNLESKDDEARVERINLTVQGTIKGGFKIISPIIDRSGLVHIGKVDHGQGKTIRLSLKIRDSETDFNATEIKTFPEFIKARIVPFELDSPGLYYIEIEIPKDAPMCVYHGDHGFIKVTSDHARIPELKPLWLRFSVE